MLFCPRRTWTLVQKSASLAGDVLNPQRPAAAENFFISTRASWIGRNAKKSWRVNRLFIRAICVRLVGRTKELASATLEVHSWMLRPEVWYMELFLEAFPAQLENPTFLLMFMPTSNGSTVLYINFESYINFVHRICFCFYFLATDFGNFRRNFCTILFS